MTVTMDDDFDPLGLMKVDVFLVEDNIWSYWCGVWANARNVARGWVCRLCPESRNGHESPNQERD